MEYVITARVELDVEGDEQPIADLIQMLDAVLPYMFSNVVVTAQNENGRYLK